MYRRFFISRLTAAATFFGIGSGAAADLQTGGGSGERFQPARHPQDDWFDQVPGKHRVYFDTTTAPKVSEAVAFATNYLDANRFGYGLEDADLAVVIGLRHRATPFAYNDAMWAKYGKAFADILDFIDPKTKKPPTINVYSGLAALVKRGVQLAVCDMATRAYSRRVSETTDGDPDAIYKELHANTIGSAHFAAAGIVAVNRAQERGYSIVHIG